MGIENTKLFHLRFSMSKMCLFSPPVCLGFPQLPAVFHKGSSGCPQGLDIYSPSSLTCTLHWPLFRRLLSSQGRQSHQSPTSLKLDWDASSIQAQWPDLYVWCLPLVLKDSSPTFRHALVFLTLNFLNINLKNVFHHPRCPLSHSLPLCFALS